MPSKGLYKETLSRNEQVPVQILTGKKPSKRFAKILASILRRKDVTPTAKLVILVYDMESFGDEVVALSDSALATGAGIGRTTVLAARPELVSHGLIEPHGSAVKQVQPYRLNYRIPISPAVKPRSTVTAVCGNCSKRCKRVGKTGWCRSCIADADREFQWKSARSVLGPAATFEQVCEYLHLDRITKQWVRVARRIEQAA